MDDENEFDQTENGQEDEQETTSEEDGEIDYQAKYEEEKAAREKLEQIAEDRKVRAEMAEKQAKKAQKPVAAPKKPNELSVIDGIALAKSDVNEEDYEEILSYANYKNLSVKDALKDNVLKSILSNRSEERTTASATNTGPARRSNSKASNDSLISNARSGRMPESDDDIARLAEAHLLSSRKTPSI